MLKTADGHELIVGNEYYYALYSKPLKYKLNAINDICCTFDEIGMIYDPHNYIYKDFKNALVGILKNNKEALACHKNLVERFSKAISELERSIKG